MGTYGVKESGDVVGTDGSYFGGDSRKSIKGAGKLPNSSAPEQRMEPHGNSKGPKHTNHREHDKMMHHMMPDSDGDCDY